MTSLIKFELKKIIFKNSTIFSTIFLFILLSLNIASAVNSNVYLGYNGLEAIKNQKNDESKIYTTLSEDKFYELMKYYQSLTDDPNNLADPNKKNSGLNDFAYFKYWQQYDYIESIINTAFSPIDVINFKVIDELLPDDMYDIYNNRQLHIENYINDKIGYELSRTNREVILEETSKFEPPLDYKYSKGWSTIIRELDDASAMFIIIILSVCIAPIFTLEYSSGVDNIILSTEKGKKELIVSKFLAAFIFTSVFYFIFIIYITLSILFVYGFSGWDSPIQLAASYWYSMYNFTFLEAYVLAVVLGYIASLLTVTITMFLSSKLKTSFSVIILSFITTCVPYIIYLFTDPFKSSFIVDLMPVNITHIVKILKNYTFYNFGQLSIPQPMMMICISILSIVILVSITYNLLKHKEATN